MLHLQTSEESNNSLIEIVKAPWRLVGRGWVFVFHLDEDQRKALACQGVDLQLLNSKSFASLMLVEYLSSNAGPYFELLFIPGKVASPLGSGYTINRILVSTQISVNSGRANWGIPKDLADFQVEKNSNCETWSIKHNSDLVLKAKMSSSWLPLPLLSPMTPIVQYFEDNIFKFRLFGYGMGRLARIEELEINSDLFPNIQKIKPILGVYIPSFRLNFPEPRVCPRVNMNSREG